MNLRGKTLAIVGGVLGGITLVLYGVASLMWHQHDSTIEQDLVQQQLSQTLWYVDLQLQELTRAAKKLGSYDETYEYMETQVPDYIASHYQDATFENLNLSFIRFLDTNHQIVWDKQHQLPNTPQLQNRLEHIQNQIQAKSTTSKSANPPTSLQGLMNIGEQMLLVTVVDISRTDGSGPSRGKVVVGRFLEQGSVATQESNSFLNWQIDPLVSLPHPIQTVAAQLEHPADASHHSLNLISLPFLNQGQPTLSHSNNLHHLVTGNLGYRPYHDNHLIGYQRLNDLFDQPTLLLQFALPNYLQLRHQQNHEALRYLLVALLITGGIFSVLNLLLLKQVILNRLSCISQFLRQVRQDQSLTERCHVSGQDELSTVAEDLNQLLDALQRSQSTQVFQQQLLAQQNTLLEAACQSAEAANRAKSEFLAMISHEIRTPLNGVVGMVELLINTPLSADQREMAQIVLGSSYNLSTIINDVLDFSKIESGKLELDNQPFDLSKLMLNVLKPFEHSAQDKEIELTLSLKPGLPDQVVSDSIRIQQILVNLISNALKFTDSGAIAVTVECLESSQDKVSTSSTQGAIAPETSNASDCPSNPNPPSADVVTLLFSVQDTGIGIGQDGLDRLFKPFSQGNAAVSRHYGGTGLGLAISHRLSQLLGGTLWVESIGGIAGYPPEDWHPQRPRDRQPAQATAQPQFETNFYFTLRGQSVVASSIEASSVQLGTDTIGHPVGVATFEASASIENLQVLLAEDNVVNQKVALRMLEKLGYTAELAENGAEVLSRLQDKSYDVILMDALMPEMDGIETTQYIRQHLDTHPYIIALTANSTGEFRESCLQAGMDDFLSKPLRLAELDKALKRYLAFVEPLKLGSDPMVPCLKGCG